MLSVFLRVCLLSFIAVDCSRDLQDAVNMQVSVTLQLRCLMLNHTAFLYEEIWQLRPIHWATSNYTTIAYYLRIQMFQTGVNKHQSGNVAHYGHSRGSDLWCLLGNKIV